jgi:hypothetical protein
MNLLIRFYCYYAYGYADGRHDKKMIILKSPIKTTKISIKQKKIALLLFPIKNSKITFKEQIFQK